MKLFAFEWKKLWRIGGFTKLWVLLLALCFLFALAGEVHEPTDGEKQAYRDAYGGEIAYVIRLAENNKLDYTYTAGEDSYIVRYQEDLIRLYSDLEEQGVVPRAVNGWDAFFSLSADDLLLLLCAVLTGIALTMTERDHRTDTLLAVTPKGSAAGSRKLLVLAAASLGYALLFPLCGMAGIALRYGLSSPFVPLCSVQEFLFCPYDLSIFSYLWLSVGVKAATAFTVAVFCGWAASLSKSYLLSFFVSACALAGGWVWGSSESALALLNPFALSETDVFLERYRSVSLLGFSVPLEAAAGVLLLLICIGLSLLFTLTGRSAASRRFTALEEGLFGVFARGGKALRDRFPKKAPKRHSLFVTELNKQLVKSRLLVLCIAMLFFKGAYAYSTAPFRDPSEHLYLTVCENLAGELTEEKRLYIGEKLAQSEQVIRDFEDLRAQFQSGKVSREVYLAKRGEYETALEEQYVYSKLSLQCQRIDQAASRGQTAYLHYDTGWLELFGAEGDLLLYAFLLLFFCGSYAKEYADGFHRTAAVTPRGMKGIHNAKRLVALAAGSLFTALFFTLDLLLLHRAFPLCHPGFSAAGILDTALPLWGVLGLLLLGKLLLGVGYALLVNRLSRLLGKPYLVLPLGLLAGLLFL
ncbi:MAG: hypothetical protein IJX82_06595 [Clostridia bacterium]|nr:hypothetical protein [Clostridia bacterium]